jgi:hypothetical protein
MVLFCRNYQLSGDSLILFFQTGRMLLIDSSKVSEYYLSSKKWPVENSDHSEFDKSIDSILHGKSKKNY